MKTMQEMAPADFQKLIALVLADLTIRRGYVRIIGVNSK